MIAEHRCEEIPGTVKVVDEKEHKVQMNSKMSESYGLSLGLKINPPILKLPDFTKEFMLRTDASNEVNLDHPVGYWSAKFSDTEKNYFTIEKEFLAFLRAIKYFRVYLLHRKFRFYFTLTTHFIPKYVICALKKI